MRVAFWNPSGTVIAATHGANQIAFICHFPFIRSGYDSRMISKLLRLFAAKQLFDAFRRRRAR